MSEHVYFVVSKSADVCVDGDGYYEPAIYGHAVEEVRAPNKREALRRAITDPYNRSTRDYIRDLRGDGRNPFGAFTVEHPTCAHHDCICQMQYCPECVAEDEAAEASAGQGPPLFDDWHAEYDADVAEGRVEF